MRDSPRIRSLSNIVSFIVFTSIRLAVNPTFFKPTIRQLLRLCAQNTPPRPEPRGEGIFVSYLIQKKYKQRPFSPTVGSKRSNAGTDGRRVKRAAKLKFE